MTVKNFLYRHFSALLVVALFFLLYFNGCLDRFKPAPPRITIVHDTIYVTHTDTIRSKPQIVKTIITKLQEVPPQYLPDTNYIALKSQYEGLRDLFLTTNIFNDSLKVDSIGIVRVEDTVQQNIIMGRRWDYSIRERIITTTITITNPVKKRNEVYLGMETEGTVNNLLDRAKVGVFLKNKKDDVFGVNIGYDFPQASQVFGAKYYKKLSLRGKQ